MKILFIIDPIESLNPKKDTTIALMRAASKKGCTVFFTTSTDIWVKNQNSYMKLAELKLNHKDENDWYQIGKIQETTANFVDVILMRKDPPFDMNYIYATYWLDLALKEDVQVFNHPQALRDFNEKYSTRFFSDISPPTLISQDINRLKTFFLDIGNVVYKPLEGMGGHNIFHVNEHGDNINVILEILTENGQTPIMAQRYIPEIKTTGDKRVLVVNGEVIPYGLARIPQGDDTRGNLARGAKGQVGRLSQKELALCQKVAPRLKEKGIIFAGLDLIGDYITEINVTSPTGLRELCAETEINIADKLIEALSKLV